MGKRGPKKKPTAIRIFEGNPGNIPIDGSEPKPPVAHSAEPPEWLGEHGRKFWLANVPSMEAIGLLTTLDLGALALYCHAWDEFHWARESIEDGGRVSGSKRGGEYQHPAVAIKNKAIEQIRAWGREFGFTPSSRVGLKVDGPSDDPSGLAAFKAS